jgi:hypothetical protein
VLAKVVTYTDYDGNERIETFRFNLTQAELTEMELSSSGGFSKHIEKIIAEKDNLRIVGLFKELILKAYGVKSDDGKRFMKSPELREAFAETEAYSILFMELATNSDAAAAFVNGIIPQTK